MKNITCVIFICMLSACTEAVDFDPRTQQKVVVNCLLTSDTIQHLTLNYSNKLNQFQYESITDAKITLFAGVESVGTFKRDKYNDWYLSYTPTVGQYYRLLVEIAGHPVIEAGTTMPRPISVKKDEESMEPNVYIRKHFMQRVHDAPYWIFVINKHDKESTTITHKDKLESSIGTNHEGCDGFNASGTTMASSFGSQFITQEHYAYLRIVPSDITENYSFYVEAPFNINWHYFRAVSVEYDKYLKSSIQKMLVYQSYDDPSQWFDETTIYSNINNGLGIFGAYIDVRIIHN